MAGGSRKKKRIDLVEVELDVYEVLRVAATAMGAGEILTRLPRPASEAAIQDALKVLQRLGLVVRSRGTGFKISTTTMVIGRIQVKRQGYGFIVGAQEDFFVPSKQMGGAFNNDIVLANIEKRRGVGGRRAAAVTRVLKRANSTIIGRFEYQGRVSVVVPADRRIPHIVEIAKAARGNAKEGDIVFVDIEEFPDEYGVMPRGSVREILGDEWDPRIEIEIILRQHGLSMTFPDEVIAEVNKVTDVITADELSRRRDFRDELVVTIDGVDARDFDDAVSIERRYVGGGKGASAGSGGDTGAPASVTSADGLGRDDKDMVGWRLAVHIADVSHYVRAGTLLWDEGENRGTSCYLVDRVIPMLPEKISNWVCSLNPLVDRLSLSIDMLIDREGDVESFKVNAGVIRSHARLTYEAADAFFSGAGESWTGMPKVVLGDVDRQQVERLLLDLRELSDVLDERRLSRGSLGFETIEPKVLLDAEGKAEKIIIRERTPATKLIEEAMILANETIAEMMRHKNLPMVYRNHEQPNVELLEQIYAIVGQLGFPGILPEPFDVTVNSKLLQEIIDFAHDRPEKLLLNSLLLRSMRQARYSSSNIGHFGLGSSCYTHFTSPIRRFPDLVVHHLVKRAIGFEKGGFMWPGGGEVLPTIDELELSDPFDRIILRLPAVAEHSSVQEREAESAERESTEVKICEYMQRHIGDDFDGIISGVAAWGFWVEIENTAEGLVHVGALTDDHYTFEPENFRLVGFRTANVYRLGQPVRVRLEKVKVGERQMDFILAPEAKEGAISAGKTS